MSKTLKVREDNARSYPCPTLIEFLLDETGSMEDVHSDTVAGYNAFLTEQRNQTGTSCLLTLAKFDTAGIKVPYTDIDVKMAPLMTNNMFVPGGGTNLRDCIGQRVRATEERLAYWQGQKPNVLFVVMTDGEDNASREYSEAQVRDLIRAHEADSWTFVYLGSTPNALEIAGRLGFQPGNSKQFDVSRIRETMTDLGAATTVYRTTGSTRGFFSATNR